MLKQISVAKRGSFFLGRLWCAPVGALFEELHRVDLITIRLPVWTKITL